MLTIADGGGRGSPGTPDFGCHVICEQPLMFMDSLSVCHDGGGTSQVPQPTCKVRRGPCLGGTSCSFSELIVNNNDDVDDDDGVVGEVDGAAA